MPLKARKILTHAIQEPEQMPKPRKPETLPRKPEPKEPSHFPDRRKKLFIEVFLQKLVDTLDDVATIGSRTFRGQGSGKPTVGGLQKGDNGFDVYVSNKPVVLVLGFGWAAHAMSKVRYMHHFKVLWLSS
jgi:hypothetical protein